MTEKRKKAAALKYNQDEGAPRVTARGKGLVAEEILKKAAENQVPVMEDSSLVELLAELNINETIPEELFQAVAEVFAFIYQTDKQVNK